MCQVMSYQDLANTLTHIKISYICLCNSCKLYTYVHLCNFILGESDHDSHKNDIYMEVLMKVSL